MSEYPSMYDAAIEYAKKGFAVFPLKYRDKVPLTRNGCKDATTDAAQMQNLQKAAARVGMVVKNTSVPELHQWLRACKRENARKKSQGHSGTKKQTKDLHI